MVLAKTCIVMADPAVCQVTWSMFRAGGSAESAILQVAGWLCRTGSVGFLSSCFCAGISLLEASIRNGYAWFIV